MSSPFALIRQIRQNHALEHATVHLLSRWVPGLHLVGRSDWRGCWLYGEVETSLVLRAALEGLQRLQSGESQLAVHPRCGTNIAATMLLGGIAVYAAGAVPNRSRLRRFLGMGLAALGALTFSGPLGLLVQQHITTTADLRGVSIEGVRRMQRGGLVIHRVLVAHR